MLDRVRDYRILKQLGEGGMGTVYLAEESELERRVAIKVLNPALTQDPQLVDRFRQEARLQSTLIHPNILTLYTFFSEGTVYCMVMEYAEGETLKALMERTGPLPERRAIAILAQILDGVGYAHHKGIIHRDLKPSNIMLGPDDTVKVMDFGIAKILGDRGLTKTGAKMGTVYYMSPEQVKAAKDIDHRTDIYSLGVTLFEMLTGRLPFNADTESDFEIMKEIMTGDLPDPRGFYPAISELTVLAMRKAVDKDRKRRFESTMEFKRSLTAELRAPTPQESLPASPAEPASTTRQVAPSIPIGTPVRSGVSPLVLGMGIAAVLVILAGLIIGIPYFNEKAAWDRATGAHAIGSYQEYLQRYSDGRHAEDARLHIDLLSWEQARASNTKRGYETYLGQFPRGKYASEAVRLLDSIDKEEKAKKSREVQQPWPQQVPNSPGSSGSFGFSSGNTTEASRSEVRGIVESWIRSIESFDIEQDLAFYAEDVDYFRQRMSKSQVRREKEAFYQRYNMTQQNTISNLDITFDTPTRAITVFDYTFDFGSGSSSQRLSAAVRKEVRWQKQFNQWKIVFERELQRY